MIKQVLNMSGHRQVIHPIKEHVYVSQTLKVITERSKKKSFRTFKMADRDDELMRNGLFTRQQLIDKFDNPWNYVVLSGKGDVKEMW